MDKKIRILIAKPGLDGHDRGAKVIARALRDAGMEVIYTGLRQTPEMIVESALQEDVDAIGLSILSGAHMTLLPRIVELLKANHLDDVLVFAGGIIPDEDIPALKRAGVCGVFGPGANTDDVVTVHPGGSGKQRIGAERLRSLSTLCSLRQTMELVEQALSGNRRALARLISQVENDGALAAQTLAVIYARTGRARVIGVTGVARHRQIHAGLRAGQGVPPRRADRRHRRGGPHQPVHRRRDPGRPHPHARPGGRLRACSSARWRRAAAWAGWPAPPPTWCKILDAAGYEVILIETVGAGQSEVDIARTADTTLVVEAPGLGDEVQAIKAGILEIADVLVVNKADREGAANTVRALQAMLDLGAAPRAVSHHGVTHDRAACRLRAARDSALADLAWRPPILQTVALESKGIAEVVEAIARHQAYLAESGEGRDAPSRALSDPNSKRFCARRCCAT